MAARDDRVREHAVWASLDSLGPAIDRALSRTELISESIETLERIRTALTFIGKRLASTDPALIPWPQLDPLNAAIVEVTTAVDAFASTGDVGNLAAANKKVDSCISLAAQVPVVSTAEDFTTLSEAAAAYRTALESYVSDLSAKTSSSQATAASLQDTLATLTASVDKEKDRIATLLAEYQSQFSNTQATRSDVFSKAEAARKERFDALFDEQKSTFSKGEDKRREDFDLLIKSYSEDLAARSTSFSEQSAEALNDRRARLELIDNEYSASATALLKDINAKKLEVENLVGVIGNLGISSGYQKTADRAALSLQSWQRATVFSLLLLIVVAMFSFVPSLVDGKVLPAELLVAKFLVTLTVGILAAYSGSQADKQYQIEKRNRRLALEFEALGPFVAPLPEERQHAFRFEIGDRSFGRGDDGQGNEKSPVTVADVLSEIRRDPSLKEKLGSAFNEVFDRLITKKA